MKASTNYRYPLSGVVVPQWFKLTDGDGAVYEFTNIYWNTNPAQDWDIPFYRLTKITDRWGRTITLQWTGRRLGLVEDGSGQFLVFHYSTAHGLLEKVVDSAGREHTLSYTAVPDESGTNQFQKLTGVTVLGAGVDDDGAASYKWSFVYRDGANPTAAYGGSYTGDLIIKKTEPGDLTTNYFYEPVNVTGGRPTSADWDGKVSRIEWTDDGHEATDLPITRVIQRQGNTLIQPGGTQIAYTYDGHDVARIQNMATGEEVNYTYDNLHNVTSIRTALELTGDPLVKIDYTYAADGRTITFARSTGRGGEVTEVNYTSYQLPQEVRRKAAVGSGYSDLVTGYGYDAKFNLTQLIEGQGSPLQQATTFAYTDVDASLGDNHQATAVTDPTGATWSTEYYELSGLPHKSLSPVNLVGPDTAASVTQWTYNSDQSLASTIDPMGHALQLDYSRQALQPTGNRLWVYTRHLGAANQPYTLSMLDPALRPVAQLNENFERTDISYTAGGNLRETIRNSTGAVGTRINTQLWYNDFDQLSYIRKPKYDTDGSSSWIYLNYNRRNTDGTQVQPTVNEGRVTQIARQDDLGDWKLEHFGYDLAGNLVWTQRLDETPDGTRVDILRDEAHRIQQVQYPADPGGAAGHTETYAYDEFGRIAQVTDNTGITGYRYDALGRLGEVTRSGRNTVTYAYLPDTTNRRWTMQVTSGVQTWEYQADTKGRLSGIINPFDQAFYYDYDPDGKPTALHRVAAASSGNPVSLGYTEYTYEHPRDWLSGISHRRANGQLIGGFTYSRTDGANGSDLTGRILTETDLQGTIHRFKYDNHGRLIYESYTGEGSREYFYDAQGNRTRVKITKGGNVNNDYYTYDDLNRLLWVNRNATGQPISQPNKPFHLFSYDAAGRVSQRIRRLAKDEPVQVQNFSWDTQDKLRAVASGGTELFSATYGADGLRATMSDSTGSHTYHRDAGSAILQDTVSGGTGSTAVHTPGLAQRSGVGDRFLHEDWLGSTRYATDGGGNVAGSFTHDAFGRRAATGAGEYQSSALMWGGGWGYESSPETSTDPGLGLVLMGQRYYDPEVGRFMSPDPIGFAGGMNLYAYVENDPVGLVDPEGLSPGDIIGAIGVGISWAEAAIAPSPVTIGLAMLDTVTELVPIIPGTSIRHGAKLLKALPAPPQLKALPAPAHGNSRACKRPTHVYRIDGPNGLHKIGESSRGVRKRDGMSIRGEQQARKLTKDTGDFYVSRIIKKFNNKNDARNYETRVIKRYTRRYKRPPGNSLDR